MMAGLGRGNRLVMGTSRPRSAFTLIEVLVVLSILVILFALLFAPMIASLDMVTLGQTRVTMQNAARTAIEDVRREVGNAMYIYPVPGLVLKGADGLLGTADDVRVPNCSEIVLVPPQRENTGELAEPLAPRTDSSGQILATRIRVAPLDEAQPPYPAGHPEDNPFVLVREEGYYTRQEDATRVWWEFVNVAPDPENPVRNVLTPRRSYDIPVTRTVCMDCAAVVPGFTDECPSCASSDLMYMHDLVQFRPERIVGEVLQTTAHHTIYQARHAGWAGLYNPGTLELNDVDQSTPVRELAVLGASELDPRLLVINPTDMSVPRDSHEAADSSNMVLTWNSDQGAVQVGAATGRWVNVEDPMASVTPGTYYPLQVQDVRPDFGAGTDVDEYNAEGTLTSAPRDWELVPVYPSLGPLVCSSCGATYPATQYDPGQACPACGGTLVSTAQPGDPAMPIAYQIDPTRDAAVPSAKIVPESVRVVLWGIDVSGQPYQTTYTETTNLDQSEIGARQFAVVYSNHHQRAEVRFNELRPPSPRMFTRAGLTVDQFGVYIQYYYRRNYDPASPENDYVIKADYSTKESMNLRVGLQTFTELEPSATDPNAMVVPPDLMVDSVSVQDQVEVRNLTR